MARHAHLRTHRIDLIKGEIILVEPTGAISDTVMAELARGASGLTSWTCACPRDSPERATSAAAAAADDVDMDVPRVDSAQLRVASAQRLADTALDLVRGDRFAATVVAVQNAGEIVLATPRGSFVSHSEVRLTAGQALVLEVIRAGAAPTLRIVDGAFYFDEQAFAEAVIEAVRRHIGAERQAAARRGAPLTMRQLAAALRAHLRAPNAPLTPEQRADAARLLTPLDPHGQAADIAAHLRVLTENGGTLLEPHLRAALTGGRPGQALPREIARDLRVLLAALLQPGTDDAATAEARRRVSAQLGRDVLERQLEQALHWVRHGTLVADLPVGDGRDGGVRMEYQHNAQADDEEADASSQAVRLRFDLEMLGRLDVAVTWAHGTAAVRVQVTDEPTRACVTAGLDDLRGALRARGLSLRRTEVVVGAPEPALADVPTEPPPSGSILRLVG